MRRGHGSTKVPNVKLRPATTKRKSGAAPARPESPSPEDDVNEAAILKSCKKPLSGICISVSGLADKSAILKKAARLGAQTSSDLTDKVTHLICDDSGSKKYQYCVEHGIPILQSAWIHSLYKKWEAGDDVDARTTMESYRLPTFKSATLCITGIDNVQRRDEIQKMVEENGGTFVKELDPDTTITHLVCGGERTHGVDERGWTTKMQFVEKLCLKKKKQIWLVWEEWLWDSLNFKGLLDEKGYLVTKKRPGRRDRERALTPLLQPISTGPSRQRSIPPSVPSSSLLVPGDDEELAAVKRTPANTTQILGGLLRTRGFEVKGGKLIRSPSKAPSMLAPPSPSPPVEILGSQPSRKGKESSLSAIKRSKSFAVTDSNAVAGSSSIKDPFARIRSTTATSLTSSSAVSSTTSSSSSLLPSSTLTTTTSMLDTIREEEIIPEGEKNLFIGLKFQALGEADTPTLHQALVNRGGTIVQSNSDDPDFIIVRLACGERFMRAETQDIRKAKYRTECWVEQCIFAERLCLSGEHPSYTPLIFSAPVEGVDRLVVHVSGLNENEKITSLRLLKAIGAKVTDKLSRMNTHLICPLHGGAKVIKAHEWNIPVVTLEWLHHIAKKGTLPLPDTYLLRSENDSTSSPHGDAPRDTVETHSGMKDITNSNSSRESRSQEKSDESKPISNAVHSSNPFGESNGLLSILPSVLSTDCDDISQDYHTAMSGELLARNPSLLSVPSSTAELLLKSDNTSVPSSNTPSPIKLGSEARSLSSSKAPDDKTDVLKSTIASLLGKRHSSDDPEQSGNNVGKRIKAPPRLKSRQNVFSRHASTDKLLQTASSTEYPLIIDDIPNASCMDKQSADDSIRVTYEDPVQRDEKIRLMTLLSSQPPAAPPKRRGKNLVRKSQN